MRYAATSTNPAPDIAELEPQLSRLFLAVAPLVNELTPVSEDLVAIGLGSASCLASKDDGLLSERYSYCVVLLGELEIFGIRLAKTTRSEIQHDVALIEHIRSGAE